MPDDQRLPRPAVRRWAVAGAAAVLLAGCTAAPADRPAADPAPGCPAGRAAPDPARPVVSLDFRLADDRRAVTGTEAVTLTPDLPVDQLWFRLVPNAPQSAPNRLTVDAVRGPEVAGGGHVDASAAAGSPGGLYRVDLRGTVPAGTPVSVELDFTLRLTAERTPAGFDRLGAADDVTWWASGFPLLTWEPGVGWARDPFVEVSGETTAAAAADTTIRVSAPEDLVVLMTGAQDPPRPAPGGRRVWTSHEPVSRDVSVAAGAFETATARTGDTRVTAGVLPGAGPSAGELAADTVDAIRLLEARFGEFPYPTLTAPLVSDDGGGGGEEYASSILLGSDDFGLVVHEVAHMWFYGMVGNSQFRDPWLDESFASFAEGAAPDGHTHEEDLDVPGDVGSPMTGFADQDDYEQRVYGKGAAALEAARSAAGAEDFDAALRCYVDRQAWTIAQPADLARALADLPEAVDVLLRAGALDRSDVG
ncbi:M1 family aminopeptidase [Trujillonella humicola]|uniref:M1 family aminopeptidase n=1 Tax=Trujillonella humicola TaxID=3383699 RepID=UPI003905E90C